MPRIVLIYPDGSRNYGWYNENDEELNIEIGNEVYSLESLKNAGAIVAVNNEDMLRRFTELGMPARPTPKQYRFTVSTSENTRERLKAAAASEGKNVSKIIETLILEWLDKKGF